MLPILTIDKFPQLRERSVDLDPAELAKPAFQAWLDDLVETMHKADGIGIAAPQTGKQIRVFVAVDKKVPQIVINPVVVRKSFRLEKDEEGCLSVPGKFGVVKRHKAFCVDALDRNGKKIRHDAKGFFARVLQHELDHLDGVLFIDRAETVGDLQP